MCRFALVITLLLFAMFPAAADSFHFTVTSDQRSCEAAYDNLLSQMQANLGGQGAFQVSPGDINPPANVRANIDAHFGISAIWYPGIGNHDTEAAADTVWLRDEYNIGHGGRPALKTITNQNGPTGSKETAYTWDYGNCHFIMLNEYWIGGTAAGNDVLADGNIVPELCNWLENDINATTKPVIIVFGHEPAFPDARHVGDSLDKYPANRDAFWSLLESDTRVKAFICGHIHYYSVYKQPGGRVMQVNSGIAGDDSGIAETFLDITINDTQVKFDAWQDGGTGVFTLFETLSVPVMEPAPLLVNTPAEAKQQLNEALIKLPASVSAAFPNFFYIQDSQKISGIRVNKTGHTLVPNTSVTVTGIMKTNSSSERYIEASKVIPGISSEVKPVAMVHKSLGGKAITDASGLSNIGLLTRIYGKVTYSTTSYFYVDDGSKVNDGSGHPGVKVLTYIFTPPQVGSFVNISGISSCYKSNNKTYRLVHAVSGLQKPPFVAYNDVIWDSRQPLAQYVTTYGIGSGFSGQTSGMLLDRNTGASTDVTVTFTQNGGVVWQPDPALGGCDPYSGTDAFSVFGGIVSLSGVVYYGSVGWWVDAEISGLDPAKRYEFVTTSNCGNSIYTTRRTKYTLSGADSFTNQSTPGVTITNGSASSTFCTGYNTVSGYVARWVAINPGTDGKFKVRAEVGTGGDVNRAYAFDAFKLVEMP